MQLYMGITGRQTARQVFDIAAKICVHLILTFIGNPSPASDPSNAGQGDKLHIYTLLKNNNHGLHGLC